MIFGENIKKITKKMNSINYSIIYKAKDKSKNINVIIKDIDLKKYSLYKNKSFNIEILNQIRTENTVNIIDSYDMMKNIILLWKNVKI